MLLLLRGLAMTDAIDGRIPDDLGTLHIRLLN
jgi:hypothetical protein